MLPLVERGRNVIGERHTGILKGMVNVLLLNMGFWYPGILVLIVTVTDYHKFSSLKQHKFTTLHFKLINLKWVLWGKNQNVGKAKIFLGSGGEYIFLAFPSSGVCCIAWLLPHCSNPRFHHQISSDSDLLLRLH